MHAAILQSVPGTPSLIVLGQRHPQTLLRAPGRWAKIIATSVVHVSTQLESRTHVGVPLPVPSTATHAVDFIALCAVYVTPYLNAAHMSRRHARALPGVWIGHGGRLDALLARACSCSHDKSRHTLVSVGMADATVTAARCAGAELTDDDNLRTAGDAAGGAPMRPTVR